MYEFPEKLFPTPQKMFFDDNMFYGFPQKRAIFYSVKDGNWSDRSIWRTVGNAGTNGLPGAGDVVYVRHTVTVNINNATCFHAFVSGYLSFLVSGVLSVIGDLNSIGVIDMTSGGNLKLYGTKYCMRNFIKGVGAVSFSRDGDQFILPTTYYKLITEGKGKKYILPGTDWVYSLHNYAWTELAADLIPSAVIELNSNFEMAGYNFEGNINFGVYNAWNGSILRASKSGGNLIFTELLAQTANGNASNTNIISFTGNPSVECRKGLRSGYGPGSTLGTGTYTFTSNDQEMSSYVYTLSNVIIDNITVQIPSGTFFSAISMNGTTLGSKVINKGRLDIRSGNILMQTGIFDVATYVNTVKYYVQCSVQFSELWHVECSANIGGISLTGNTILHGNLSIAQNSSLNLVTYSLLVNGTTTLSSTTGFTVYASIESSITFVGALTVNRTTFSNCLIEARGGISGGANFGTGTISFTTNSQSINSSGNGITAFDVIINGVIITITGAFYTQNSINGSDANSKILCNGIIEYYGSTEPMTTGILDASTNANTFKYNGDSDQEVKGTTYRTLEFGGSGVKKLMGNVVVDVTNGGGWSITGTATIDYNGFTITTI